ncbi:hypothetical protein CL629_02185 [bacterium]|nr:hypothetical protein [bacterium]|tara:strand:+ start:4969 stop:5274 length:306 start_codon:yes stop_codon:yes gene_type:complete
MKGNPELTTVDVQELVQSIHNNHATRRKLAHYTVEQWDLHQVFEYAVDILEEKYEVEANLFNEDLGFYCEEHISEPGHDPARLFSKKDYSDKANKEKDKEE